MILTHVELIDAVAFAAQRHANQTRKGDAGEPYVNHVIEVAGILSATDVRNDIGLLMAALLHDTIEDTDTTEHDLSTIFGADVTALVIEATDDKTLKKDERKRLQVERAPHKSSRARLLKTADKISNLRSIASSPPSGWHPHRMTEYVNWAEAVVSGCLDSPAGFDVEQEALAAAVLREVFSGAVGTARHAIAERLAR